MSESDIPQYKMVNGELVELSKEEIAAIKKERAAAEQPTKAEVRHERSRSQ